MAHRSYIPFIDGKPAKGLIFSENKSVTWEKCPDFWLDIHHVCRAKLGNRNLMQVTDVNGTEYFMTIPDYVDMTQSSWWFNGKASGVFRYKRSRNLTTIRLVDCDHGGGCVAKTAPFVDGHLTRVDRGGSSCVFVETRPFAATMELLGINIAGEYATLVNERGKTYPMRLAELENTLRNDMWSIDAESLWEAV